MFRRAARFLIPPVAALLLLAALVVGLEYWLRGHAADVNIVAAHTELGLQPLLEPSALCHHQLRPKTRLQLPLTNSVVSLRINSNGLRGPELAAAPDQPWRILVLGDDTVFGAQLSERQTLTGQLQQLIESRTAAPVEVLNGGVPGDCPLLTSLRFPSLQHLRPQLVILHLDMSDVDDDALCRSLLTKADGQPVCIHPALRTAKPGPPLPVPGWIQHSALFRHAFAALRHDVPPLLSIPSHAAGQQQFTWIADHADTRHLETDHALQPLVQLQQAVAATGGKLLVTTCPVAWQLVDGRRIPELTRRCRIRGATPYASREPFVAIAEFCARERMRFVDASSGFRSETEPQELFSPNAPVPSAKGIALYAQAIADYLFTNPPGSWESAQDAGLDK